MKREEIIVALSLIKTAYPRFYTDMTESEVEDTVQLWTSIFKDDNKTVVIQAIEAMITTLRYPPTIADIKEKIQTLTKSNELTELEAWNLVSKAIANSSYNAEQEFYKLPPLVQKTLFNSQQLRQWGLMDIETVQSVIQSNFMRSYRENKESKERYDALPESAKQMMNDIHQLYIQINEKE